MSFLVICMSSHVLLLEAQRHVDSYKLEQVGSSAERWLKSRASGGLGANSELSRQPGLAGQQRLDLPQRRTTVLHLWKNSGSIETLRSVRDIKESRVNVSELFLVLGCWKKLDTWTPLRMTAAPCAWIFQPRTRGVALWPSFGMLDLWCCLSKALLFKILHDSDHLVLSGNVISLSAPSRWLLAAQQCVSAPQSTWFALQELALCQMDVGAARCVLRNLTRTAAPWGRVTTTKGWSVITAMMWPWPGASVEVRGEENSVCWEERKFTQKIAAFYSYLHCSPAHVSPVEGLVLLCPILKINMVNVMCCKDMDVNWPSFPWSQSHHSSVIKQHVTLHIREQDRGYFNE